MRWLGLVAKQWKTCLTCVKIWSRRKWAQVNASARKALPNGVASRLKFSTCVYGQCKGWSRASLLSRGWLYVEGGKCILTSWMLFKHLKPAGGWSWLTEVFSLLFVPPESRGRSWTAGCRGNVWLSEREGDWILNLDLTGWDIDTVASQSGRSREKKNTVPDFSLKNQSCLTFFNWSRLEKQHV